MKTLAAARQELIEALVAEGGPEGISAGLLEKDEHLSDALAALFALKQDGVQLVFCGGSSLAKAHRLIERMSEDADLKVVLSPELMKLSGNQLRTRLSRLKNLITTTLAGTGLEMAPEGMRALNGNRYFSSQWRYQMAYESVVGLRPYLQVEFTVRNPVLPVENLPISRLIDDLAGRQVARLEAPTVALAETVAEKVLSFLRRFAQHRHGRMQQQWDVALARHLYDVHCAYLQNTGVVTAAAAAFPTLVEIDLLEFGRQFPAFQREPLQVLESALQCIESDTRIQDEYASHLLPLVYGGIKPAYADAFASFKTVAVAMLETLD